MLWQYGEKQYVRSCAFLDERTLMACTAGGSILLLDAEDGVLLSEAVSYTHLEDARFRQPASGRDVQ